MLVWQNSRNNTKHLNAGSGSRQHVTVAVTVNAAGDIIPPCAVSALKRNVVHQRIEKMPISEKVGKFKYSVSPKGFMTSSVFLECLEDLNEFVERNMIQKPVACSSVPQPGRITRVFQRCELLQV